MQLAVCVVETPAPEKYTNKPEVQLPPNSMELAFVAIFGIGDDTVTTGAVVSKLTVRVAVPMFPTESVWLAVMVFEPSPVTKVIFAEYVPEEHEGVAPVATPLPAIVTV